MTELYVNRTDLQSFTQILDGLTDAPAAPKALLSQLVTDISAAMGDLDQAEVTVVPAPEMIELASAIGESFATAFTPAADSAGGHAVQIQLHKILWGNAPGR